MLALTSAPLALPPTLFTNDNTVLASRFADFKLEHSRSYESAAEESARYSIFVENLKVRCSTSHCTSHTSSPRSQGVPTATRLVRPSAL